MYEELLLADQKPGPLDQRSKKEEFIKLKYCQRAFIKTSLPEHSEEDVHDVDMNEGVEMNENTENYKFQQISDRYVLIFPFFLV